MNRLNADRVHLTWQNSRVFAAAEAVRSALVAGTERSRALHMLRNAAVQWHEGSADEARLRTGVLLVVAAITNVVFVSRLGSVSGWMVFIIPAASAAAGTLAIITAILGQARNR